MNGITPLRLNKEFKRAYGRGKSFVHSAVVTYVVPTKFGGIRLGITTGKKMGSAVERNRARRVIRAAFMKVAPEITASNLDIVFVARHKVLNFKSTQLEQVFRAHLNEAGVIG